MRLFKRKPKEHNVEVHDVRPDPELPEDLEPYFAAICSCGWVETRSSSEEAFQDAYRHSPNVADELKRPVG